LGIKVSTADEEANYMVKGDAEHVRVGKEENRRASEPPPGRPEALINVPLSREDQWKAKNSQIVASKNAATRESRRDLGDAKR
jgi:hypothetical protein